MSSIYLECCETHKDTHNSEVLRYQGELYCFEHLVDKLEDEQKTGDEIQKILDEL